MEKMSLWDRLKSLLQQQEELEEDERKKKLGEKKKNDNFIVAQISHERIQQELRRQEEEYAREQEQAEQSDEMSEEERAAQEEERQMKEADEVIDLLGFDDGLMDEETCRRMVDDLVSGRKVTPVKKPKKEPSPEKGPSPEKEPPAAEEQLKAPSREEGPEPKQETPVTEQEEPSTPEEEHGPEMDDGLSRQDRAHMIGCALKNFSRYIAAETPLSAKHVEAARLCTNILKRAAREHFTPAQMGLKSDEWKAIQGSVQLGNIIRRGLEAKLMLADPAHARSPQRDSYLRSYLTMNAVEQVLKSHVQAHGEEIAIGEGPLSSIQILLGTPGFSARDMWTMVGQSEAMARLRSMRPERVAQLVSRENREMDDLGRKAMTACYDGSLRKEEPKTVLHRRYEAARSRGIDPQLK